MKWYDTYMQHGEITFHSSLSPYYYYQRSLALVTVIIVLWNTTKAAIATRIRVLSYPNSKSPFVVLHAGSGYLEPLSMSS